MPTLNELEPSPSTPTESAAAAAAPELEAAATESTSTDATPVESSTTDTPGDNAPKSLLEAIDLAVTETPAPAESPAADKAKDETPAAETPDPNKEANPAPSGDAHATPLEGKEGDKDLPFHKHPRFQEIIQERNRFREEATGYKEDAETFRGLTSFMEDHGLTDQHVNESLEIAALLQTGRVDLAYEKLLPVWTRIQTLRGEILPDDVAALVESGEIADQAAKELARSRQLIASREAQDRQQAVAHEQAQRAHATQAITGAVNQWEARIAASNPDFAAIKQDVFNRLKLANSETPARSPQEAVALAEKALADALAYAKAFRSPAPAPITPAPVVESSTPQPTSEPKSVLDAVNLALGGG